MTDKVRLTILEGGRDKQTTVNTVTLAVIPDSTSPLPVDTRVFEEDTYLVLTVDPVMRYTEEHPVRLMTRLMETNPQKTGSIVTNNASWYAVVHDLDAEPTWRTEWVKNAYLETFMLGEKKRVQRIGLPLLGSVHGNFSPVKSLEMLIKVIKSIPFQHLKRILLLVPPQDCKKIQECLQKLPS
jgi:hypothetical protein